MSTLYLLLLKERKSHKLMLHNKRWHKTRGTSQKKWFRIYTQTVNWSFSKAPVLVTQKICLGVEESSNLHTDDRCAPSFKTLNLLQHKYIPPRQSLGRSRSMGFQRLYLHNANEDLGKNPGSARRLTAEENTWRAESTTVLSVPLGKQFSQKFSSSPGIFDFFRLW